LAEFHFYFATHFSPPLNKLLSGRYVPFKIGVILKKLYVFIFTIFVSSCANFQSTFTNTSWQESSFNSPQDELSCDGRQLVQYNQKYEVYVGLTLCNSDDQFRVYMSDSKNGPYLPVTDTGGHGQDHCELVNAEFSLPNSDNINSGGCSTCSTSRNLPLEYVETWARSGMGNQFMLVESGRWSYQTSKLQCGVIFQQCSLLSKTCEAVINNDS